MEHTVPLSYVTWIFGAIATLLGGCWAIFKYFESQLNRLYRRMDENKTAYYNDFVLVKVFRESNDVRKELTDQKFESLIQLFNEKIESLRSEIRTLKANNHKEDK